MTKKPFPVDFLSKNDKKRERCFKNTIDKLFPFFPHNSQLFTTFAAANNNKLIITKKYEKVQF